MKNIKRIQEQLKALKARAKEAEKLFLLEVGKATLAWFRSGGEAEELKARIVEIMRQFGIESRKEV